MVDGGGSNNRRDLKRGSKGGGSLKNLFKKIFVIGCVNSRIILRWGVERV